MKRHFSCDDLPKPETQIKINSSKEEEQMLLKGIVSVCIAAGFFCSSQVHEEIGNA